MPDRLDRALELFSRNPFSVAPEQRARALDSVDEAQGIGRVLGRLRGGDVAAAEAAWIALGHVQACRAPGAPRSVLGERSLPPWAARRLPRPRATYLRVVLAAGRCYRALSRLSGTSDVLEQVRRETWSACFGQSLLRGLACERVVRDHDVLIVGETGVGKEPIARALQEGTVGPADGSPAPSAVLNAAAIPDALIESELFGHVRGAFTGAARDRMGRLRRADGGCFFLDEVGDLPMTAQVKLLRVMETDLVDPVGSDVGYQADIRYVAATHRDLARMVDEGTFRRDLYQRLAGNVIQIPPLRERPEDILDIGLGFVTGYLGESSAELERVRRWLTSREVVCHPWPGNVRELQNALRNTMLGLDPALGSGLVRGDSPRQDELPERIRSRTASLREVEDWYIEEVLERVGHNYTQAAHDLELDRTTVRRRARNLHPSEGSAP